MESNGKRVDRDGQPRRLPDRPDRLGRARHQRPARVLPADPPGHEAHPVRLPRAGRDAQPARRPPRDPARQLLRADRSADARQDRGRGPRRAGAAGAAPAQRSKRWCRTRSFPGNRPTNSILLREAHAAHARRAGRALRAQDLRAGRHLEHQQLRPVGRGARQAAGQGRSCPSSSSPAAPLAHDGSTNALIDWCRGHIGS